MATTPKSAITELEAGQDGFVIFNDAVREFEQSVSTWIVKEIDRTAPPGGPAEGDSYWVLATGTGAWAGHNNEIAYFQNGVWKFQALVHGSVVYDQETAEYWHWTGSVRQRLVEEIYHIAVANPTAAEDRTIVNIGPVPYDIYEVEAVLLGSASPSVTWTLRRDTDRNAAGTAIVSAQVTTNTTTGDLVSVAHSVPANSFLWLETSAQSGTVTELHVTIRGRKGR